MHTLRSKACGRREGGRAPRKRYHTFCTSGNILIMPCNRAGIAKLSLADIAMQRVFVLQYTWLCCCMGTSTTGNASYFIFVEDAFIFSIPQAELRCSRELFQCYHAPLHNIFESSSRPSARPNPVGGEIERLKHLIICSSFERTACTEQVSLR